MQAIGDPGQGWCNAIFYIVCSPVYGRKLLIQMFAMASGAVQACLKFSLNISIGGRIEASPLVGILLIMCVLIVSWSVLNS